MIKKGLLALTVLIFSGTVFASSVGDGILPLTSVKAVPQQQHVCSFGQPGTLEWILIHR